MLKLKQILTLISILLITACAAPKIINTPPHTVDELRSLYVQFNRVFAIKHKIFVSNSSVCTKTNVDYGFIQVSVDETKDETKLWIEAFNLKKQPTVTYVAAQSASDRAGLRIGDAIISVNNSYWSDAKSQGTFTTLLSEARKSPHLHLGILRGNKEQTLNLTADRACDYGFMLNRSSRHEAWANNRKIIVDLGAAKLLKRDDELAFLISHELAHILLGHTLPDRQKELDDYKMRNIMEKDADAFGIRLMIHAGYDPKGAETALKSTDLIDSGPVTTFFNYHGPYMPVDERIQYLRNIINQ